MPYQRGTNQYVKRGWRNESVLLNPIDLMAQVERLHEELGDPQDLKWPRSLITLSMAPWDDLDPAEQSDIVCGVCVRRTGESEIQLRQRQAMVALLRDGLTGVATRDRALAQAKAAAQAQAPSPVDTSVLRVGPNRAGDRANRGQRFQGITKTVENTMAQYPDREWSADELAMVFDEHDLSVETHGEVGKLTSSKVQRVTSLLRSLEWAPGGAPGRVQRVERAGQTLWRYNSEGDQVQQTQRALDARVTMMLSNLSVGEEFDSVDLMISMHDGTKSIGDDEFDDRTENKIRGILGSVAQQGMLQRHGERWKVTADCSALSDRMDIRVLDSKSVRETVIDQLGASQVKW